MRAVTETTVYFGNFENIDLFFQGYYFFKCRMYYEVEDANLRVYSTPFCQYLTSDLELRVNNSEQRILAQQNQRRMKKGVFPPSSFLENSSLVEQQ